MNFSTKPAACGETAPQKREQLQEKTVKLTFLGHACFLVQAGAHTLILDPFLTNSRTAAMRAADVEATHMLISHAHGDHIGDAAPIAERCGCTVFCTPETGAMLHAPHARQENGQPGGRIQTEFGSVKFLPAEHGSGERGHQQIAPQIRTRGAEIGDHYQRGNRGGYAHQAVQRVGHAVHRQRRIARRARILAD